MKKSIKYTTTIYLMLSSFLSPQVKRLILTLLNIWNLVKRLHALRDNGQKVWLTMMVTPLKLTWKTERLMVQLFLSLPQHPISTPYWSSKNIGSDKILHLQPQQKCILTLCWMILIYQ
jgi:hypothetical protein